MELFVSELKNKIRGDVLTDKKSLDEYSRDTSIFEIKPRVVVFPKDREDLKALVKFVNEKKKNMPEISLTARSGGTDMTGGPLNESIIVVFTKYMNRLKSLNVKKNKAVVEPGLYYRDFEKKTLTKGLFLPSYPASKSICALGGMIANNAGGEKTLAYGKTERYVKKLKVILSDGNEYVFKKINKKELQMKMKQKNFEGKIYREVYQLMENNFDIVQKAKPNVSKNSAGYYLWNVWDRKSFDLTQLFVGSQGTLGIITEAEISLVKKKKHSRLVVCFLKTTKDLNKFVNIVLPLKPESLETFDDSTLKLAVKFLPEIAEKLDRSLLSLVWGFRKEGLQIVFHGMPKFTVLVEMTENDERLLEKRIAKMHGEFKKHKVSHLIMDSEEEGEKYWTIRRESFNLLRKKVKDKRAAAFIDDFAVKPGDLPEFFPKLEKILDKYDIHATISGHAGSGNFHIIPLMDLKKASERAKIPRVSEKVYELVSKYNGTITAEHNDGLIRTPYLDKMFNKKMIKLFEQTKKIFDPQEIFNPGKKVHGDIKYAMHHVKAY